MTEATGPGGRVVLSTLRRPIPDPTPGAQVYVESDLRLCFGPAWLPLRFDAHPHYRQLAGRGVRGVDFVLLHRCEPRVVLVEVKNYRRRFRGQTPAPLLRHVGDVAGFAERLHRKRTDTVAVLRLVDAWYRRKWWWPLWGTPGLALARRSGGGLRQNPRHFFPLAHAFAPAEYHVVLELEDAYPEVDAAAVARFGESLLRELQDRYARTLAGPLAQLQDVWR